MLVQLDKLVQLIESPVFTCKACDRFVISAPDNLHRPSPATLGARPISLPVQVLVWNPDVATPKLCLCFAEEPYQRSEYQWLHSYCA